MCGYGSNRSASFVKVEVLSGGGGAAGAAGAAAATLAAGAAVSLTALPVMASGKDGKEVSGLTHAPIAHHARCCLGCWA